MSAPRKFSLAAAMAMAAAIGGGMATPAAPASPVTQRAPSAAKEYVGEKKQRPTRRRKKKLKYRDPNRTKGQPWKDYKDGSAIDGRGDYRSPKRLQRQRLCALHGVTSGRQWVRLRRELRRAS